MRVEEANRIVGTIIGGTELADTQAAKAIFEVIQMVQDEHHEEDYKMIIDNLEGRLKARDKTIELLEIEKARLQEKIEKLENPTKENLKRSEEKKTSKSNAKRVFKEKSCEVCGNTFVPRYGRQTVCDACTEKKNEEDCDIKAFAEELARMGE